MKSRSDLHTETLIIPKVNEADTLIRTICGKSHQGQKQCITIASQTGRIYDRSLSLQSYLIQYKMGGEAYMGIRQGKEIKVIFIPISIKI